MKLIEGGICAVRGVRANGIKQGKNGLAIIVPDAKSLSTSGVFTRNKVIAAPLIVTRDALAKGELKGIIANSGCANAFTGEKGITDAKWMAGILANKLKCRPDEIGVGSTGVIGRYLDRVWIEEHLDEVYRNLRGEGEASKAAARAIMTTDTAMKEIAIELDNGVRIGGISKGSGMIEPNMGTMLAFLYTDAVLSREALDESLKKAVDRSFNMVVVDGDTSTNDIAILTATGYHEIEEEEFQEGLDFVCMSLSRMIARDGEGATRLIEARVKGALSLEDAKKAAKAIVRSPLVKTAIFGKDPNWGRVVAAAGYSGAEVDQDKISLKFSNNNSEAVLVDSGRIIEGKLEALKSIMESDEIIIEVDIGLGDFEAIAWGCDLTYDYVKINAMYTT
ncbi:MAG: bifunctional ornithine acetyltransferase/N-acetylglutamate synthase [Candidatus Methanoperedens sp.]|nr:bifunctional ornithine acetyltransferase/N-acetylglutamate synthase [Candidatus Methanoperedens sp.]MCZ7369084.1 bifunctional ornithine acetyltransferase/N-acetylglutamate synthase [Candidatus Methanoperedens sp.]